MSIYLKAFPLSFLTVTLLCLTFPQAVNAELATGRKLVSKLARNPNQASLISQAPAPLVTQQGNQVVLNGRTMPAAWSRRQQQFGVSDVGLTQAVGLELLSTGDATRQPVQWFSQSPNDSLTLAAWLTGQYRYLNITDLIQRAGWQVQAEGATLRIVTPLARVLAVRQGRQVWGDRIVVDLDRATPWQISEQGGELIVTIDAQIDPRLVQNFQAGPGNQLTSLRIETGQNQTIIRLGTSGNLRPRTMTLVNPNRLVIDLRPDAMVERDIVWASGLRWRQQILTVGNAQFPVISLLINPRQPGVALKPIWSNPSTAVGIAPLITTAQRWQVAAAINGGFFNRNNQLPLGAVRQDGRWVSGPILNRGAIAWNEAGEVQIGRLSLQETITTSTGQSIPILHLNSGYVQAGTSRYTPEWGPTYSAIADNEIVITVQNDQVMGQQPTGVGNQTAFSIPSNGYLLVVRSNRAIADALPVGTTLRSAITTAPADFNRYSQIMGGGPLLLQNRQIVLNAQAEQFSNAFIAQSAARSAIGTTADGSLIMVAVQNRVGGPGVTLTEIAQIMQRLGAVDALNLDGGSSTTLYLGGQVLNRPARTTARVHNGIGVFIQPTP